MSMFKIGDKVKCIEDEGSFVMIGATGTILEGKNENGNYLVEWDTIHLIDDCSDNQWYINEHRIELQSNLPKLIKRANLGLRALQELFDNHQEEFGLIVLDISDSRRKYKIFNDLRSAIYPIKKFKRKD